MLEEVCHDADEAIQSKLNVCEGLDVMIEDHIMWESTDKDHLSAKVRPSTPHRESFSVCRTLGPGGETRKTCPTTLFYFLFSLVFTLQNIQFAVCSEVLEHSSTFQITNNCQSQWQKKKYASRTVEDWILRVSWHGSLNAVTTW